ncbi:MAG: ArsR/SmtB family transcription factor [Bacillota bacterium]
MPYTVQATFAPAHELVMSLDAYLVTTSHRNQDLGEAWAAATRAALPPALARRLEGLNGPPDFALLSPLIRQCPDQCSAAGFLDWLGRLSPGELYERLAPFTPPGAGLPPNLGEVRSQYHATLSAWHEAYFSRIDPVILTALAAEADAIQALATQECAAHAVEEATNGIWLEETGAAVTVYLIPQYHKRPLYLHTAGPDSITFYYPLPDLPTPAGEPPASLLRLTRTLADESRLRILYILGEGPLTFSQVLERSSLTKGTVSRHIWWLRFAGLVRAHYEGGSVQRFSLRPDAFSRVARALSRFAER